MIEIPEDLRAVLRALARRGRPRLVGGCVRDALLGRAAKDVDIEVFGIGWEDLLAALAPWGTANVVGRSFAVAKLRLPSGEFDVSLPRRESKTSAGHRGFTVEADPEMSESTAASRRDYTVNSLLYDPIGERLLDFHGGQRDLAARVLRHTSDAFAEDPLRVLRGFQLAARFGMTFDPETARLCASIKNAFDELPKERVWMEWDKFATKAEVPSKGLRALQDSEWLAHFPELAALVDVPQEPAWHPEGGVFTHTGHCADALVRLPPWVEADADVRRVLMFAVVGHDFGKAQTTQRTERHGTPRWVSPGHAQASGPLVEAFLARLGSPLELRPVVRRLVENHHAHQSWPISGPSATTVRRLARKLQPATIRQLLPVLEADHLGRPPLVSAETALRIEQLRSGAKTLELENAAPAPLTQGRDLIALGMIPGPAFGPILKAAYEAQLDGEITSAQDRDAWLFKHCAGYLPRRPPTEGLGSRSGDGGHLQIAAPDATIPHPPTPT